MNRTEVLKMLRIWHDNVKRVQIANADAATLFSHGNLWLGIPTIIVTAMLSTSAATDILKDYKWVLALLGILATVLTGLQAFLNFGERSANHANAANEYGCLKRRIQQFLALPPSSDDVFEQTVDEFRKTFDGLMRSAPHVPHVIWRKALRRIPLAKDPWQLPAEGDETAVKGDVPQESKRPRVDSGA